MSVTGFIVDVGSFSGGMLEHTGHNKLWNTDGFWWCITQDATSSDWQIYKKDGSAPSAGTEGGWTGSGTYVDTRDSAKPTIFWDESTQILHVVAMHGTAPRYTEWDYDFGADTYTKNTTIGDLALDDAGNLGSGADGNFRMSMAVDGTGQVWIAFIVSGTGLVLGYSANAAHTNFDITTVDGSIGTSASLTRTTMIPFNDGSASIGVGYNDSTTEEWNFAWHVDSDGDTTWSTENIIDISPATVDDHTNIKQFNGKLFYVTKNGGNTLVLYTKPSGGSWDSGTTVVTNKTRPQCVIDATNSIIYVFYTDNTGSDDIVYKTSPTGSISFSGGATTIIENSDESQVFNDIKVPFQNVNSGINLPVITENRSIDETWWNEIDILSAGGTIVPQVTAAYRMVNG